MKGRFRMLGDEGLGTFNVEITEEQFTQTSCEGHSDRVLTPGFVDMHIHGAFGIDFMPASPEKMVELANRLSEVGYEAFLPTTVSASAEAVLAALRNLPNDPRIPGFHLEGPFLSPKYPGAQPPEAIADFAGREDKWATVLEDPRLKVATLAPETPGALELATLLASRNVRVSMGHTNASFAEAKTGFQQGVRHSTHTFNAMRGIHHREAGALGFALLEDDLACELIYDRLHVTKEAAALLLRCKPKDKVIAVSDGTMASGLPRGQKLEMWGCRVETRDGGVYLEGTETLAGSAITMLDAFRNLAADFDLATAIRVCCRNPRTALGWTGPPAVWLEWSPDLELIAIHRS